MSTPFPPPSSLAISTSTSAAGVGLGYGIAIAVGLLVLTSTILLASYLCVRSKSPLPVRSSSPLPPPPSSPPKFVVGLDPHTIDVFYPKFVHQSEGDNKNAGWDGVLSGPCPICLGEYATGDELRRGPDCGHCFHAACVDEWLRLSSTCPLCRSSPVPSPAATPLLELIPLARSRGR
jgi:Ring finger domain